MCTNTPVVNASIEQRNTRQGSPLNGDTEYANYTALQREEEANTLAKASLQQPCNNRVRSPCR